MTTIYCNNCDHEAVGFYQTEKETEFHLCLSCREAFELGQVNHEAEFCGFHDEDEPTQAQKNCGGIGECCGCEVCTPDANADDYDSSKDNWYGNTSSRSHNDPCQDDDMNTFPVGGNGGNIEHSPWRHDNDHDSAKAGIEVESEALDIEPVNKATLAYLMFQELDLECSGYSFPQCPWDSHVGYECMKVLRKAREFIDMLHDLDSHQDIWSAAFGQCDVFYCG